MGCITVFIPNNNKTFSCLVNAFLIAIKRECHLPNVISDRRKRAYLKMIETGDGDVWKMPKRDGNDGKSDPCLAILMLESYEITNGIDSTIKVTSCLFLICLLEYTRII